MGAISHKRIDVNGLGVFVRESGDRSRLALTHQPQSRIATGPPNGSPWFFSSSAPSSQTPVPGPFISPGALTGWL